MAIAEVIKYNGSPDIFIWKYPSEELGTWTQLIVNESQEAILVKSGQVLDLLGPGRHTLSTNNIPFLSKLVNLPLYGRSPFTAEVWFINKAYSLDIKWGTPSPIQIQEPKYNIFVPVRANGAFGLHVEDSKRLLVKLVGTLSSFDSVTIKKYFRGLFVTTIKDTISSYIIKKKISILEINAYLDELSTYMANRIRPTMEEYGVGLPTFYVNEVSIPEDDSGVKQLKDALAKRAEMDIVGYSYQQERSFDVLETAAGNQGTAAPLMGAGLGLGMGFGVSNAMGSGFGAMASELNLTNKNTSGGATKECPKCHAAVPQDKKFCGDCGFNFEESAGAKKLHCSSCGAVITKDRKFCNDCGRKLNHCANCGDDIPEAAAVCPTCGNAKPTACPKCGTALPPGAKFCHQCGASLTTKCRKCGREIIGDLKFCPECGNKL